MNIRAMEKMGTRTTRKKRKRVTLTCGTCIWRKRRGNKYTQYKCYRLPPVYIAEYVIGRPQVGEYTRACGEYKCTK
ncbi:MAG: hypothetical protein GY861_05865 [bacterium]|nr:hypothetical protein [bacterium]